MKSRISSTIGFLVVLALIAVAAVGSATAATTGLHVIAKAHSSGDFAVTSVSAKKANARALYLRAYGRDLSTYAVVSCSKGLFSIGSKSTELSSMRAGRLYKIKQPFVGDCDVVASLSGSGSIRLQVLA